MKVSRQSLEVRGLLSEKIKMAKNTDLGFFNYELIRLEWGGRFRDDAGTHNRRPKESLTMINSFLIDSTAGLKKARFRLVSFHLFPFHEKKTLSEIWMMDNNLFLLQQMLFIGCKSIKFVIHPVILKNKREVFHSRQTIRKAPKKVENETTRGEGIEKQRDFRAKSSFQNFHFLLKKPGANFHETSKFFSKSIAFSQ